MVNDLREPKRNYQIPSVDNFISEDFPRLALAITSIGFDVDALMTSVSGKAALAHTHTISNIVGLQTALDLKLDVGTTYLLDDLSDVVAPSPTSLQVLLWSGSQWQPGFVAIDNVTGPTATGLTLVKAADKPAARRATGQAGLTTHGDSAYTILAADRVVVTSAAFTADRIWTLPAANTVNAGDPIFIMDQAGAWAAAHKVSFARSASDTINGGTAALPCTNTYGGVIAVSDGVSAWTLAFVGANAAAFLLKAGDTMSGDLGIAKASPVITLNKAASGQNAALVGQTNGVNRIIVFVGDQTAEGGSNTGSYFSVNRYNDAGTFVAVMLSGNRATGVMAFEQRPTFAGNYAYDRGNVKSELAAVALVDAATIAFDMNAGWNFKLTIGGNRTLGTPSNFQEGQAGFIRVLQDGTGSRTLAFASAYKFQYGVPIVLTTTPGGIDIIHYEATGTGEVVLNMVKGIA